MHHHAKGASGGNAGPSQNLLALDDRGGASSKTKSPEIQPKSWRDWLPVHPAAELFPPISAKELRALSEDVKEHGIKIPIVLFAETPDHKYSLLDGRARLNAMELPGIEITANKRGVPNVYRIYRYGELNSFRHGPSGEIVDPYAYVVSANLCRRHLTGEQKRDLIAALLKATPEKSNRQIADTVKASHHTVEAVRTKMESTGQIAQLPKTIGKDRRARASKRKRPKPAVPKPPPTETAVPEAVAPDEELDLLREFARFVIARARVSTEPKDQIEWKVLLDRVKQVLGAPSHPPDGSSEMPDLPDFLRRTPPCTWP
jgi:hypothetical protein